ncbi:MAG: aminotransferase class I/II-fold pyridoxal phosphate-dependent enzyme [Hahellaceae bacterium]|nr:aminotransferase class I/II-fold pyridoxal phosphate-dependent enzyme [Hahellaceae bacterium]
MDQESFDLVMQPKAYGAWNLHLLTRNRKLDFFVLLSSISAVIGNLGQANYVAANMFCEAVANERRRLRLPALALQLDRIKDVGFVTRSPELAQHFSRLQWRGIHSAQAFEALQRFLANGACQGLISSFKWTRQSSGLGCAYSIIQIRSCGARRNQYGRRCLCCGLRERLSTAGAQEQLDIVAEFLRREIADVLRVSPHLVSFDRPLKQIGIDSLMAVELMARIEAKIGIALPIHRFAGESTPLDLVHGALSMLSGDSSPVAEPSHHTLQRLDSDASRSIDDGITQGTVSNGINPLDAKATIQAGGVLEPSSTSPRDAPPAAEPDQRTESYQMIGRPAQSNDERSLITRSAGEHEHMHYQMRAQMIQQRAASKGTQMAEEAFVPKMPDVKPIRPKADKHRMNVPERFTRLDLHPGYLQLVEAEEVATTLGIPSPFFREHQGPARDTIRIGSKDYINYATYNYFGFSGDPDIIAAASEAMREHGTSAFASRVVSGQLTIHSELERAIASTLQVEDCVVLVSGHATNVTTIGYLFGPRDLIVHDELIHNSIIQGIQLAGSKRLPFPHNDWGALRAMLDEQRLIYERVLIVLEGIYSMDGDFPDLPRFIELKRRYQCFLMVDEAHSFGVMGRNGLGIREHFNLSGGDIDIWMGTLSKTLAACGGFIAGSSVLVENLRHLAPGILYSVGLAPSLAGAALASLAKLLREPRRVDVLHARGRLFLDLAKGAGIDTGTSAGLSVIPAITGSSLRAMLVSNALFEQGINVLPVIYPAVPEKQARLRFFVSCLHTEEQIRGTVTALAKALDRH